MSAPVTAPKTTNFDAFGIRNTEASVTASESHAGKKISSRNVEEVTAELHRLLGTPARQPEPQQVEFYCGCRYKCRIAWWHAEKTGECCGACGRAFEPNEPAWLCVVNPRSRSVVGSVPVCGTCYEAKKFRLGSRSYLLMEEPCENCGRPLTFQNRRYRIYCSRRCESALYRAERKRALGTRTFHCPVCDSEYDPGRADAKYCSNACRQKAYRRRSVNIEMMALR